jgi:hypothetical protein
MPDRGRLSILYLIPAVCFLIYDVFIVSQIIQLLVPVYIILWPIILLLYPLYIPVQPVLSSRRDQKLKLFNDFERQRVVDCTLLWMLLVVGYSIGFENILVWGIRIVCGYVKWEMVKRGPVIGWLLLVHIRGLYGRRRM